eukprot:COSAG04_NODE_556_length_12658_cov_3.469862_2_plen_125_part_00
MAYSLDGITWTCYTQSDDDTQGGTPSMVDASADCNEGPSHAASGSTFNIPFPAKFVSMAFWGHTDIYEIELTECDTGESASVLDYTFYFGATLPATAPDNAILDDGTGFASGRDQGLSYGWNVK